MNRRHLLSVAASSLPAISGCSGIASVGKTTPSPTPKPMTPFEASKHPEVDDVVPFELAIHERTNEVRSLHSVGMISYDPQLAYVSRKYSRAMGINDEFGHQITGEPTAERLWDYGINCSDVAENIFYTEIVEEKISHYSTDYSSESTVRTWLNSDEGHRENLLNDEWAYEGIGVYVTADAKVYVTQTFTARDCDGPGDPPRYDGEYDG